MAIVGSMKSSYPSVEDVFLEIPSPYDSLIGNPAPQYNPVQQPVVSSLFSAEQAIAPYEVWYLETMIRWREGNGAMPVAPPVLGTGPQNKIGVLPIAGDVNRQPMQIPRLVAPYGYMLVFWAGRRLNQQPTVPLPVVNSNAVFEDMELHVSPPKVLEDNTLIHSWTVRYLFYLKKPVWELDGISMGVNPAHTLTAAANTIPASTFKQVF
jgi:hypothetical protein